MAKETIAGNPIDDALIEEWADEAERGYPINRLRKRGRPAVGEGPSTVIQVRVDGDLLKALTRRADREHVNRSEAVRAAIRSWTLAE
jgi:uncharacterized protein (DUF4415 family)